MSKFYLYKVWFTSAFVIPILWRLYDALPWKDITIENLKKASFESVQLDNGRIIYFLLLIIVLPFAFSFPILVICRIAQYYLVQKINSEVFVRIFIIFFVALLMFIVWLCLGGSFRYSLEASYLGSISVVLASIYHSFRDRLDSSRNNQTLLIRFWL